MKKFMLIAAVLILASVGVFGYSVKHYYDVTRPAMIPASATVDQTPAAAAPSETLSIGNTALKDEGIFSANYDKAAAYVANLSTEQKVGQMLMGITSDPAAAAEDMNRYPLSGMLFDSACFEYKTKDDIKAALARVSASGSIPPILAAQEEGGRVTTLSGHAAVTEANFDSPRNIFEEGGLAAVEKAEGEKSALLKELGFGLNLAPVVDMPDMYDQIMYSRSLSNEPQTTATFAEYVAKFNQAKGVSVTLKHFPGYGTIHDTYDEIVVDTRDAQTIRSVDYYPFKAGASAGAHFIMISNVVVQNIDPTHTAALSPILHRELRDTVGFTGLVITDVMDKVDYSAYADGKNPVVAAVLAGNDIILVRDYAAAYQAILAAVNDKTIDPAILDEVCTRIIAYKYTTGLLK